MNFESDDNLFTFVWRIENCRMSRKKTGECIDSPKFLVKKFLDSKWYLRLYPKGLTNSDKNNMSCYLMNVSSSNFQQLNISCQIMSIDNPFVLPKNPEKQNKIIPKGGKIEFLNLKHYSGTQQQFRTIFKDDVCLVCLLSMDRTEIENFMSNEANIVKSLIPFCLKPDSLPTKCSTRLFESVEDDLKTLQNRIVYFPHKCFARTFYPVERKSFNWSMDNILRGPQTVQSGIAVTISDVPDLLVTLFYNNTKSIKVSIETTVASSTTFFAVCNVFVSDPSGKVRSSIDSEYEFSSIGTNSWVFELILEDQHLSSLNHCYLYCDIALSEGIPISWLDKIPSLDFSFRSLAEKEQSSVKSIQEKMKEMYDSKRYCDVTLQIRNRAHLAHKAVLCANSSVFNAMFENNMKEKLTNVIVIEDLDPDILDYMLKFMYCDFLEQDVQFETAMKLYEAADRFQIQSLHKKCLRYMMTNMTVENVCPVLQLGDVHNDTELKEYSVHFIFQNINEILYSEEWNIFSKDNLELTNEVLQVICMKFAFMQTNQFSLPIINENIKGDSLI